jgi:small-conductance mechanosensitive channel
MASHVLPLVSAAAPADSLDGACKSQPGIACQLVWDVTHSAHLASLTRIYLAGPVQLALRILFVIALALVARVLARRLIDRVTSRVTLGKDASGERNRLLGGERRQQRATALGSVLGNAATVTIFAIALFIVLGDMGLNLAPILASAGVLGIALGFGAQNLVQDFLAGIFMLMEDQYGVGDVINVRNITGTVEAVSLRITRVRDVNGVVWHIRNGTIGKSGNESHGWARAVVDFPVPYVLDTAEVRALMEATATRMWEDQAWRDVMTERPEVWGIEELSGDSVVIRVIARTAPLRQWDVSRELRERLKVAVSSVSPAAAAEVAARLSDGPGDAAAERASAAADLRDATEAQRAAEAADEAEQAGEAGGEAGTADDGAAGPGADDRGPAG